MFGTRWAISPASIHHDTSEARRGAQRLADTGHVTLDAVVRGGGGSAVVQAALDEFAARALLLAQWSSVRAETVADGAESAVRTYGEAQIEMAGFSDRRLVESDRFAPRNLW